MSSFLPRSEGPRPKLFMSHYSFDSHKQPHTRLIDTHPFNHTLQVFLPTHCSPAIHSTLVSRLLKNTFYYHAKVPLSLLLTPEFMQHARNGMIALSVDGGIDTHNIVCLDGNGSLVLALTKDTYEQLGLDGVPSKFSAKRQRYVVKIDLRAPAMVPKKPGFERVKWCFENTLVDKFSMLFASVDAEGNSLPIEFPSEISARKLTYDVDVTTLHDIVIPDTTRIRTIRHSNNSNNNNNSNVLQWRSNVSQLHEWIGMVAVGSPRVLLHDRIDPYLCVYNPPAQKKQTNAPPSQPSSSTGSLLRISGFLPAQAIQVIFQSLRNVLDDSASNVQWAHCCVWGFEDSPISWRDKEHQFLLSGENMYGFFLWSRHLVLSKKENQDRGVYVMLETVAALDEHQ
ncbi:Ribonuclease P protein subunit p40 [Actinomortierella ambigua]|uniref:Ribonuclease P protein subunit p40 n=1 Tax=Actinomortierella ambigua TaxID=1343610 RepID=A0A9P6QKV8_9FUNG|nr:Ribonuclease P protein subunit p40 [Actinomortierella ambigua]